MLFYMQMKNWFLVFLMVAIVYLIQQKSSSHSRLGLRASAPLLTLMR